MQDSPAISVLLYPVLVHLVPVHAVLVNAGLGPYFWNTTNLHWPLEELGARPPRYGWSTLALPVTSGIPFVSFVTFLIADSGQHPWTITDFALHQLRSTPQERDGFHHEPQTLLANSPCSSTTA